MQILHSFHLRHRGASFAPVQQRTCRRTEADPTPNQSGTGADRQGLAGTELVRVMRQTSV